MKKSLILVLLILTSPISKAIAADLIPRQIYFSETGAAYKITIAKGEKFEPRSIRMTPDMALYSTKLPAGITKLKFHFTIRNSTGEVVFSGWTSEFNRSTM